MNWTIEVRNYRCFTESHPLRIDLSNPVTAFVGPNNSGKTSALKFFWEFGQMLYLVPTSVYAQNQGSNIFRAPLNIQIRTNSDQYSVFTEKNARPLTIDFIQHPTEFQQQKFASISLPRSHRPFAETDLLPAKLRVRIDRVSLLGDIFFLRDGKELVVHPDLFSSQQNEFGTAYIHRNDEWCYFLNNPSDFLGFHHSTFVPVARTFGTTPRSGHGEFVVGQNLIGNWDHYKLSNNAGARKIAASIESEIARIFDYIQLEINSNGAKDDFLLKINNGNTFLLQDMGSGISHFITILFNVILRSNQIVLVDEPEIGIHASLQFELMSMIARYANGPVLFATHSIGLARGVADHIISFKMKDGESISSDFERSPNYLETLGELSFSAWREIGCDRVVFVEGVHDVKVMREWLKLLGGEFRSVVLPLGGSEFIRSDGVEAIKQVLQVHPKVAVVIDSERANAGDSVEGKREKFALECAAVGIACLVTGRRAFENYFTQSAISNAVGGSAKALGEFEKLADHGWGKRDGMRIAAAMTREEIVGTDIGAFLLNRIS